ncbi:MAG TPA: type II toxin-antitoxin system HicB family antitoxin [Planctomycetota bacterium]|jgi:predicted RNase H-like HicB family nuclease
MIDLDYALVIEATDDPTFFSFFSPDLPGFTGVGHSIEDCVYQARWGMREHVELLRQTDRPVPKPQSKPTILVTDAAAVATK